MTTYMLENGAHYKILVQNKGPVPVEGNLSIDGNGVGHFVYQPNKVHVPLERPLQISKKFRFYTVRAVRAAKAAVAANKRSLSAGEKAVAKSGIKCDTPEDAELNGLVSLVVNPARAISIRLPFGGDRVVCFDPRMTMAKLAQVLKLKTSDRDASIVALTVFNSRGEETQAAESSLIMNDHRTLKEMGINVNYRITLSARHVMPIYVMTETGNEITVHVTIKCTVKTIKTKIQALTGIRPERQQFFYFLAVNFKIIRHSQTTTSTLIERRNVCT